MGLPRSMAITREKIPRTPMQNATGGGPGSSYRERTAKLSETVLAVVIILTRPPYDEASALIERRRRLPGVLLWSCHETMMFLPRSLVDRFPSDSRVRNSMSRYAGFKSASLLIRSILSSSSPLKPPPSEDRRTVKIERSQNEFRCFLTFSNSGDLRRSILNSTRSVPQAKACVAFSASSETVGADRDVQIRER